MSFKIKIPDEMSERLPRGRSGFTANHHYDTFRKMLFNIVEEQQPMTVRQVFYQAVVRDWVEKTEHGYGYIQRDLVSMRWSGMLDLDWIIDTSRTIRGSQGANQSVDEFMNGLYERIPLGHVRDLLADHDFSIQVWLEKEALAGVIHPATSEWDVPLYCARGYSSLSFLHEAAKDLETKDRPARIFHFGDYDPSGQDAIATVQRDLPLLAPKTASHGFEFTIVAVKPEQVAELGLPTRPTKRTDTRASSFGSDQSVELDAIPPNTLRQMVNSTLRGCFKRGARKANEARQEAEREEIRQRLRRLRR
ncbi:hypothetical protein SAMN05444161_3178 [Rhizobiales bacterium GAS191]|nr:hypothetical protein SAMN05444161_3178 [Rhizobiales bacterium GAS191]